MRAAFTKRRVLWGAGAVIAVAAVFFAGYAVGDDSGQVSDVQSELASAETKVTDLTTQMGEVAEAKGEASLEIEGLEEELAAERSLNGKSEKSQTAANQEYNTDFPWKAAGTVGYLTMKPIAFEQVGERWILTVEAKNDGNGPKQPFCGGGEAVVIDAEDNNYTGEAVLGETSDNCGEELQPGLTGTFKSEFKLPSNAVPVGVALYGDYEQSEEAKTWELPH